MPFFLHNHNRHRCNAGFFSCELLLSSCLPLMNECSVALIYCPEAFVYSMVSIALLLSVFRGNSSTMSTGNLWQLGRHPLRSLKQPHLCVVHNRLCPVTQITGMFWILPLACQWGIKRDSFNTYQLFLKLHLQKSFQKNLHLKAKFI